MSEQTGGAKIDEIHTLATDGFTHLMGDELKTTAQVAKQLVKDIKGNPDKRVNNLATQLNKDADELIKILGGPAAPSTGLFSGLSGIFGSKTATPSPSPAPPPPSISTTPASGSPAPPSITTTSASGPPAPPSISTTPASKPQILPDLTTSLPASTMSSSTTAPPPPSGKKEYKSTKNWLQKIDIEQRLQLDLEVAMNTVLTEPTDTKKPELENARTLLLNKRKEIQGLKDIIETKDRVAKEDFIKKVKEYTESFKAYNKTLQSLDKRSFGNYFRTLTTTRKSNINKMTRPPPNKGNSNTFSATNPSRNTSQNTEKSPSFGNRLRRTFRLGKINKLTAPRDPALNMPRPAGPQTLTIARPVEKENRPVSSVIGMSPLEKGEGSRQLPGLPQSDNLGSINPSNSSSKTPRNFASMIFSNKPEEAKKFREKLREGTPGQRVQETSPSAANERKKNTNVPLRAPTKIGPKTFASPPSTLPVVPSSAASSNQTGRNNTPSGTSSSSSSGSNQSGPAQRKSTSSNRSSSSSSGGLPYSQESLSQTEGPAPYVASSNPLQTGLNTSKQGFVKQRAQNIDRAAQQQTPVFQVPTTPYGPVYGIQGIQRYTKPKGGARHTRKYSKKQANRQTRRG